MSEEFDALKKENLTKIFEAAARGEDTSDMKFDIYAQDPNDWSWLSECVPGLIMHSAGGLVPFQAEGLINGHPFYYKERGGSAHLNIGEIDGPAPYLNECIYTAREDVEEFRRGPEWISTFMNLVENLKISHFRYKFEGNEVILPKDEDSRNASEITVADGVVKIYEFWGNTPKEALDYHYSSGRYIFVDHYKWPAEFYEKMSELENINPVPINKDDRAIPAPSFEVNVPEFWRNSAGKIEIPEEVWVKSE